MSFEKYRKIFETNLQHVTLKKKPENLYDPVHYILNLPAKRIRPVLTLMAADGYGIKPEDALPAAIALEIFHNFTLIHDDIMDKAEMRRGKITVHKKWNTNSAILSGDVMIFSAQQFLEHYPPEIYKKLQSLFNKTAIEICEGQQEDMDFEQKTEVSVNQYMEMIRKKTAVLLGTALAFAAIIAGKNQLEQQILYEAGINLGVAFQIADDYLDTFGNTKFGKEIGGDIKESKKTFLYTKLLEKIKPAEKNNFISLYNLPEKSQAEIEQIKSIFEKYGIPDFAKKEMNLFSGKFIHLINSSTLSPGYKTELIHMAEFLKERTV